MLSQYYHTVNKDAGVTPPQVGNAVICGYTNALPSGTVCGMSVTVWVAPPNTDIVPGITVFTNRFMTAVLLGQLFIRDSTGVIYEINPSNGVVGNPTGLIC